MNFQKNKKEKQIKFIKNNFYRKTALLTLIHLSWLFFSNLAIVISNELYIHNEQYVFFMSLGSTVVIITGLFSIVHELKNETADKIKQILKNEK